MTFKFTATTLCSLLILAGCSADKGTKQAKSNLPPQPPIWVVSDADSEITLYPTLHILPPELEWKSEELFRRIGDAEEVWFEIKPDSENDPALQRAMINLGLMPGSSLSSRLSEEEITALKAAIEPLDHMSFQVVDQMRPWLAWTIAAGGSLMSKGFDPNAGVEKQIQPMAAGKKIRALETAQSQMEMLASLPEDTQMELLRQTLLDLDEGVDELKELAADWAIGDVEDMEDELLDEMKRETPIAYEAVFTTRNKNWVEQIEEEMKGSGIDFIAVGAGHLVGEDSVPAMLRARGYTVTRL